MKARLPDNAPLRDRALAAWAEWVATPSASGKDTRDGFLAGFISGWTQKGDVSARLTRKARSGSAPPPGGPAVPDPMTSSEQEKER